ncbi:hypothetical protein [Leisingera caerulea]|nr:hypothetical protein [Leisingera caerulea]
MIRLISGTGLIVSAGMIVIDLKPDMQAAGVSLIPIQTVPSFIEL